MLIMLIVMLTLTLFCGIKAIHTTQLLDSTLWLAGASALVAAMLYAIGAWEIAVIELSVGAGLVTVLMVFAITMIGNEAVKINVSRRSLVLFTMLATLLLVLFTLPDLRPEPLTDETALATVLWQQRGLDMVGQVVLIFAGVLGVLGLLSVSEDIVRVTAPAEKKTQLSEPAPTASSVTEPQPLEKELA